MKRTISAILSLTIIMMMTACGQTTPTTKETPELKFLIKTSMGDIKVKLYNDTPKHRDNFLKLVNSGWYKSSIFHRVINAFMIQGGGKFNITDSTWTEDVNYTIPAEILDNHFHFKGVLAAARMPDQMNPKKESSGCQFYIVQGKKFTDAELDDMQKRTGRVYTPAQRETYKTIGGTPHLDGAYTIFGEVYEGLDVVDKIAAVKTNPQDNKPLKYMIFSITQIK